MVIPNHNMTRSDWLTVAVIASSTVAGWTYLIVSVWAR